MLESNPRYYVSIADGIVICINDDHPEKVVFPIEVTEERIEICFNDEHL